MELGKVYKKTNETSYALGASLTYELLTNKPEAAVHVYFHPDFNKSEMKDEFVSLCVKNHIHYSENEKIFRRLSDKEKCTVIGEFVKFKNDIDLNTNHLVLVNPGNMGNLGTIIRSALGFGIHDIAIVKPAVDIYDPKVVRASMGAVFRIRFSYYDDFSEYQKLVNNPLFCFRLNASESLSKITIPEKYSLVFGNESSGLPHEFDEIGQGVIIKHSGEVDSFALPMAVTVGLYEFTKNTVEKQK